MNVDVLKVTGRYKSHLCCIKWEREIKDNFSYFDTRAIEVEEVI